MGGACGLISLLPFICRIYLVGALGDHCVPLDGGPWILREPTCGVAPLGPQDASCDSKKSTLFWVFKWLMPLIEMTLMDPMDSCDLLCSCDSKKPTLFGFFKWLMTLIEMTLMDPMDSCDLLCIFLVVKLRVRAWPWASLLSYKYVRGISDAE